MISITSKHNIITKFNNSVTFMSYSYSITINITDNKYYCIIDIVDNIDITDIVGIVYIAKQVNSPKLYSHGKYKK